MHGNMKVKFVVVKWQSDVTHMKVCSLPITSQIIWSAQDFTGNGLVQPFETIFVHVIVHISGPVFVSALCSSIVASRQVQWSL